MEMFAQMFIGTNLRLRIRYEFAWKINQEIVTFGRDELRTR